LLDGKDLYQAYPGEHWDYYKYSPTFALLMTPLAIFPDLPGLMLWNLINVFVLFFAISRFPLSSKKVYLWMLGFMILEMINSTQNSQSNCLLAGMLLFAFLALEKKQVAIASLLVVGTVFIKVFGIVAFSLFLFYPGKLKAALFSLGWVVLLLVLPLLVISPEYLIEQYQSWMNLLVNDRSTWEGLSVAGFLDRWFDINFRNGSLIMGVILFCIPLLKFRSFEEFQFRALFLASILIWIVIFNFRAESATFVIAVSGIAIWYFIQTKNSVNTTFLILAFIFTILSPTDLFPRSLRNTYVIPYALKALPCILIWIKLQYDLLSYQAPLPQSGYPANNSIE
jgi:hypothetical protein